VNYLKKIFCLLLVLFFIMTVSGCGSRTDDDQPEQVPFPNNPTYNTGNYNGTNYRPITSDPTPTPMPTPIPSPTPRPSPTPYPGPMELYTGPIFHVFYHSLAAFPEIAFSNSFGRHLDHDTITPREFWRSLEELYRNNYVLININDAVTLGEDGRAVRLPLYLPVGKRPLVMSFDDINFYTRNLGRGTADKVILDEHGNFAMSTRMPDGTIAITYDNCIIPMLEEFIAQHPGFSPFGVRGMLALTGFDGILGYRTQAGSPNRESEIEAVKPIVAALKERGWYFASHGFGHVHMTRVTLERFKQDTNDWIEQVGALLGPTNIFVFPYGEHTYWQQRSTGEPMFQYLIDRGFTVFCGVGIATYNSFRDGFFFMDRANIDGFTLRNRRDMLSHFMDVDNVYYPPERLWGQIPVTW